MPSGRHLGQGGGGSAHSVPTFIMGALVGVIIGAFGPSTSWVKKAVDELTTGVQIQTTKAANVTAYASSTPKVFNFIKELGCRSHHMGVPPLLTKPGQGKVVVDIGLDKGDEFFAALESGYSVYGFEANPLTVASLRKRCEEMTTNKKCVYVDGKNITEPLPPITNGGYLIEAGAGESHGVLNMSLSGPGSSFAEVDPTLRGKAVFKMVKVLPVSDVVDVDVFFFKLDVQGYEFNVLKGAKGLFEKHSVKTLLMEVYPRGLLSAGTDFGAFLQFIWDDLGMMCSSANPTGFAMNHPQSLPEFGKYLEDLGKTAPKGWWGTFDDFYCFNRIKLS